MTPSPFRIKLERMSDKWINASEISDYLYCRRAWWLRRMQGVANANVRELRQGTTHHQQHGRLVQRSIWVRRLAMGLLFVAVAYLAYTAVAGF